MTTAPPTEGESNENFRPERMPMRLLLAVLLLAHGAAMGQTFACQYTASAGLNWENGRWEATRFKTAAPFFLNLNPDGTLDRTSVAIVFYPFIKDLLGDKQNDPNARFMYGWGVTCKGGGNQHQKHFACMGSQGDLLTFNSQTQEGGVASLGSLHLSESTKSDSLSVKPFTCQKM